MFVVLLVSDDTKLTTSVFITT